MEHCKPCVCGVSRGWRTAIYLLLTILNIAVISAQDYIPTVLIGALWMLSIVSLVFTIWIGRREEQAKN